MKSQKAMKFKSYTELSQIQNFEDRYDYLKLNGIVGAETFGFDRIYNQQFYKSKEWKKVRDEVILRDNGCDLGIPGREISGKIYVHHMNPLQLKDIQNSEDNLLNPDFLICVSHETHNAIHYGDQSLLPKINFNERKPNDTCPWRK